MKLNLRILGLVDPMVVEKTTAIFYAQKLK